MEDFVTWVDTSKLKRTIMRYNDEVSSRLDLPDPVTLTTFFYSSKVGRFRLVIKETFFVHLDRHVLPGCIGSQPPPCLLLSPLRPHQVNLGIAISTDVAQMPIFVFLLR